MGEIVDINKNDEIQDAYSALGEVEETDEELFTDEYTQESLEAQFETGKIDEKEYDTLVAKRDQKT